VDLLFTAALLAHFSIWALTRLSGNRFIKTVDWMVLIWFGIGLTRTINWLIMEIRGSRNTFFQPLNLIDSKKEPKTEAYQPKYRQEILITIALILVGVSPSLFERVIPGHYNDTRLIKMIEYLQEEDLNTYNKWSACQALNKESTDIILGRAIYPRFYDVDEILGNDRRGVNQDPSQSRINFYLVGMENLGVTFKGAARKDIFLHQTDIAVSGSIKNERYIEANCAFGIDPDKNVIYFEQID
jgi:hypothetical protein